ncbi:MAG: hypothetical protein JSU07_02075 [Bacteroidetes bacterium]|nr:hypothetical protein [Bacteroidota bacterium]
MFDSQKERFKLYLSENTLFYVVEVFNDISFNIDDMKQLTQLEKNISGAKKPVLVLCHVNATTDNDLLKFLSKNENNPYSIADAFVITSLSQKILANFYLKFLKPERPTKFFVNKNDAINWLNQFA